jgi:hypothetical protein
MLAQGRTVQCAKYGQAIFLALAANQQQVNEFVKKVKGTFGQAILEELTELKCKNEQLICQLQALQNQRKLLLKEVAKSEV